MQGAPVKPENLILPKKVSQLAKKYLSRVFRLPLQSLFIPLTVLKQISALGGFGIMKCLLGL